MLKFVCSFAEGNGIDWQHSSKCQILKMSEPQMAAIAKHQNQAISSLSKRNNHRNKPRNSQLL